MTVADSDGNDQTVGNTQLLFTKMMATVGVGNWHAHLRETPRGHAGMRYALLGLHSLMIIAGEPNNRTGFISVLEAHRLASRPADPGGPPGGRYVIMNNVPHPPRDNRRNEIVQTLPDSLVKDCKETTIEPSEDVRRIYMLMQSVLNIAPFVSKLFALNGANVVFYTIYTIYIRQSVEIQVWFNDQVTAWKSVAAHAEATWIAAVAGRTIAMWHQAARDHVVALPDWQNHLNSINPETLWHGGRVPNEFQFDQYCDQGNQVITFFALKYNDQKLVTEGLNFWEDHRLGLFNQGGALPLRYNGIISTQHHFDLLSSQGTNTRNLQLNEILGHWEMIRGSSPAFRMFITESLNVPLQYLIETNDGIVKLGGTSKTNQEIMTKFAMIAVESRIDFNTIDVGMRLEPYMSAFVTAVKAVESRINMGGFDINSVTYFAVSPTEFIRLRTEELLLLNASWTITPNLSAARTSGRQFGGSTRWPRFVTQYASLESRDTNEAEANENHDPYPTGHD